MDTFVLPHSVILGFYTVADSKTKPCVCQSNMFSWLNQSLFKLQPYCFDRASSMSGPQNGVRAKLKEVCSDALYVHCSKHALDFVSQEAAGNLKSLSML